VNALRTHARQLLHEYKRSPTRNKIGVWKDATIWRTFYAVVYRCDEIIEMINARYSQPFLDDVQSTHQYLIVIKLTDAILFNLSLKYRLVMTIYFSCLSRRTKSWLTFDL